MTSPVPDITVVIPTYNRRDRVERAVESVLGGSRPADQVIVVDDGSGDGTAEALEPLRHRLEVLRLPENRGVAAARNAGIRRARGRWIALLDSDDVWCPDHLERLADHVRDHPTHRLVQSRERWYRKGRRVNPPEALRPLAGDIFIPSVERCLVSSSAVLFERALFADVGGYDERLPACEDYDLWLRLARATRFGLVDAETVEKDGGRPDQLSRRIWGLDRFRVFALAKLLVEGLDDTERYRVVHGTCLKKLEILEGGARRRDDGDAVRAYQRWRRAIVDLRGPDRPRARLRALLTAAHAARRTDEPPDPILDALRPKSTLESPLLSRQIPAIENLTAESPIAESPIAESD